MTPIQVLISMLLILLIGLSVHEYWAPQLGALI